jgi:hypothetical protein
LESDLVLVVSNVSPWTEKLMSGKKTHVSHWKRYFRIFIIACIQNKNFGLGVIYICVCVYIHPGWLHVII